MHSLVRSSSDSEIRPTWSSHEAPMILSLTISTEGWGQLLKLPRTSDPRIMLIVIFSLTTSGARVIRAWRVWITEWRGRQREHHSSPSVWDSHVMGDPSVLNIITCKYKLFDGLDLCIFSSLLLARFRKFKFLT